MDSALSSMASSSADFFASVFGSKPSSSSSTFAVLQALEERKLLLVHLEEFRIPLAVEGRVFQEQK
jgi:hypothetical protein